MIPLCDFYDIEPQKRDEILLDSICERHTSHFSRNDAYRTTVSARGVGPDLTPEQLPRVLRVSAITFKGYIERLGTPFPQDQPQRFLEWLADQLSIEIPLDRATTLRSRYGRLESLLNAIETLYADLGLEIVTSSGTSGKFTILVRDESTLQTATDAYFTGIERAWGINAEHVLVMVMPEETRVAMAHIAHLGTRVLEWDKVEYTMPFKADPDTIRVRTGRTFRPGLQGAWERRVLNAFMAWADRALAQRRFVGRTGQALERSAATGRPVMLLGGLVQLDAVAQHLLERGGIDLAEGSRIATGGGLKQAYPRTPDQIRADLGRALRGPDGKPLPVTDIYGMAEANWGAFQCIEGHYHLPPWVYVAVMDHDDRRIRGSDVTGLLAFWDPLGGGEVYPPFFQTADRVRLVNGSGHFDPARVCPCGDDTPYFVRNTIQRVDLIEEAGCGAIL
jgi:hypothetical protein